MKAPLGVFLGLFVMVLAGCSAPEAKVEEPVAKKTDSDTVETPVPNRSRPVDLPMNGKLAFFRTQDGKIVKAQVGDSLEHVFSVFPKPPRAIDANELPAELKGRGLTAQGWDNPTGRPADAFATIMAGGRSGLLMRQLIRTTSDGLEAQIEIAKANFGEPTNKPISVGNIGYWFWEDSGQRYMICAIKHSEKDIDITVSLGTDELMNTLRMSPTAASADAKKADAEFNEANAKSVGQPVPSSK